MHGMMDFSNKNKRHLFICKEEARKLMRRWPHERDTPVSFYNFFCNYGDACIAEEVTTVDPSRTPIVIKCTVTNTTPDLPQPPPL